MGTFFRKEPKNATLSNAKAHQWAKKSRKVQPIQGFKEIRVHQKNQPEFVWQKGCLIEANSILAVLNKKISLLQIASLPQNDGTECQ